MDFLDAGLARDYPDVTTRRGRVNRALAAFATTTLAKLYRTGDHHLAWLVDVDALEAGTQRLRYSVLSELGRIQRQGGDEALVAAADRLRPEWSAGKCVHVLRAFRGARSRGSATGLLRTLAHTIDAYTASHDLEDHEVDEALRRLLLALERARVQRGA